MIRPPSIIVVPPRCLQQERATLIPEPQLASDSHLSEASLCRAAGRVVFPAETDLDGEAWNKPPSIGCDEYYVGSVTGALTVAIVGGVH